MLILNVTILLVFFTGMVLVLRWLTTQQTSTATAHLQGLSQDYLKKHEELKKRLEEAERQYQEQLGKAQEEAQQLKSQALKEVEALRQQVVEEAHQEADRIVQRAVATQQALKTELQEAFDVKVGERAFEMLAEALPDDVRRTLHEVWVDELLRYGTLGVEAATVPADVKDIQVRSAYPLTPEQEQRLQKRLRAVLGREMRFAQTQDAALIAGVLIAVGNLVFDGTLVCKVKEAVRHAQHSA